jgi:hypothetical protein
VDTAHSDAGQLGIFYCHHHLTDNPKALKAVTTTRQYGFAGFMINWVADSVILQMKTGWCPILKKCFMTMPN